MVLNNTNKNYSKLLETFVSVFTVSSYFTDNPRMFHSEQCENVSQSRRIRRLTVALSCDLSVAEYLSYAIIISH